MEQKVAIMQGDFHSGAGFAGDDEIVQIVVVFDVTQDVKGIRVFQAVDELAAFAAAVGVINNGVDLADVGVHAEAQEKHLEQRHGEGKEECAGIAAHMQSFLIKDGAETSE
jgi:hypothetical protein